jgi:hypothetical protein
MGFIVEGTKMTQKYRCGDDYTNIFSSLADVRSYQRNHDERIYVCEFKHWRPATEQDWRSITVKRIAEMRPWNTAPKCREDVMST